MDRRPQAAETSAQAAARRGRPLTFPRGEKSRREVAAARYSSPPLRPPASRQARPSAGASTGGPTQQARTRSRAMPPRSGSCAPLSRTASSHAAVAAEKPPTVAGKHRRTLSAPARGGRGGTKANTGATSKKPGVPAFGTRNSLFDLLRGGRGAASVATFPSLEVFLGEAMLPPGALPAPNGWRLGGSEGAHTGQGDPSLMMPWAAPPWEPLPPASPPKHETRHEAENGVAADAKRNAPRHVSGKQVGVSAAMVEEARHGDAKNGLSNLAGLVRSWSSRHDRPRVPRAGKVRSWLGRVVRWEGWQREGWGGEGWHGNRWRVWAVLLIIMGSHSRGCVDRQGRPRGGGAAWTAGAAGASIPLHPRPLASSSSPSSPVQ